MRKPQITRLPMLRHSLLQRMSLLEFPKIKVRPKDIILWHSQLLALNQVISWFTHIVRKANVSKKRMIRVALPVQNQAGGDDFKLCVTTFSAYTKRFVVSGNFCKRNIPNERELWWGKSKYTWNSLDMLFEF